MLKALNFVKSIAKSPAIVRLTSTAAKTTVGPTTARAAASNEAGGTVMDSWSKFLNSDLYSSLALGVGLLGAGGFFVYTTNKNVPEGDTRTLWQRVWDRVMHAGDSFVQPSRSKLLPDLPVGMIGHKAPYTLVLDLEGTLVHSAWDRSIGAYRTVKRPGVDLFLAKLSSLYEIVVFTSSLPNVADPVIEGLDPTGVNIRYRLYRDSTTFKRGHHIKDLTRINRDPSRIVFIDGAPLPDNVKPSPENRIPGVPIWTGDVNDRALLNTIPLLENIAIHRNIDVRVLFEKMNKNPDPLGAYNAAYISYMNTMLEKFRLPVQHVSGTSYFDVMEVRSKLPRAVLIPPYVFDEVIATTSSPSLWSYLGF